jgi:hypothetical protein
MKLPTVEFNGKVFIWDSRLGEFRPEEVDLNWRSLPVGSYTEKDIMDQAVREGDLKMQKLVLLDTLDYHDWRGIIQNGTLN